MTLRGGKTPPPVCGEDDLRVQIIVEAALYSTEHGGRTLGLDCRDLHFDDWQAER